MPRSVAAPDDRVEDLARLRPLNARSIVLSVLLGMHPPQLSAARLVRLGALFDISSGAMRTALSRSVRTGELELESGRYRLVGALLGRQRAQDLGRSLATEAEGWNGDWSTVFAIESGRSLADRRAFRATMTNHRLGELRPTIWMRPANRIVVPDVDKTISTTGPLRGPTDNDLVAQLWNLPAFDSVARDLLERCRQQIATLDWETPDAIVPSFELAATILRFLRREPLLPIELQPVGWPIDDLRTAYAELERCHQHAIRRFLSDG